MKKLIFIVFTFLLVSMPLLVFAEDKPLTNEGGVVEIPKIPTTPDDPALLEGHVYPFWGPVCQRYTYSVIYRDQKGRAPEYVRMYFNGDWLEMEKAEPENNDYQKGVKYIYKFVPEKIGSNFFFFEASNGLGKARDSIIDSPDNGPVLFDSAFDQNEVVLINKASGQISWRYLTGKEWIGGVALSDEGKYLAVQSWHHVYFFDTESSEPLWSYETENKSTIGGDVKGGVALSADGSKVFAALGHDFLLFSKDSNEPLWQYHNANGNAYNVAISADGQYLAAAMAGGGGCLTEGIQCDAADALILWSVENKEPLWMYQTTGNFHDVSFSSEGQYLATATGCPDRRAYIFSKDSNEPILKSEMLTVDSPVDEAQISADGSLAAFGAESGYGAIFLFSRENQNYLWKYPTPQNVSARALAITPDGEYIGAATTIGGQAFIFQKDSAEPVSSWQVNTMLGALDISEKGDFIAAGGKNNKVYVFEQGKSAASLEIELKESVGEIDLAANGEVIAAGTSGSVYFFESLDVAGDVSPCQEIIEPEPEPEDYGILVSDGTEQGEISEEKEGLAADQEKQTFSELFIDFLKNEGKFVLGAFIVSLIIVIFLYIKYKKAWLWLLLGVIFLALVVISYFIINDLEQGEEIKVKDNVNQATEQNLNLNSNTSLVNENGRVIEKSVE